MAGAPTSSPRTVRRRHPARAAAECTEAAGRQHVTGFRPGGEPVARWRHALPRRHLLAPPGRERGRHSRARRSGADLRPPASSAATRTVKGCVTPSPKWRRRRSARCGDLGRFPGDPASAGDPRAERAGRSGRRPIRAERRPLRRRRPQRRSSARRLPIGWRNGAVHLPDAQGAQGPRRQGHPRRRHAGVPAGREDRRRRAQRRRQVDGAEDDGRPRAALERRRPAQPRASRSASCCRSRRSTRTRTCAATSRKRSPRSATSSPSTRRSTRRWRRRTPTSTCCSAARPS